MSTHIIAAVVITTMEESVRVMTLLVNLTGHSGVI